MSIDVVSQFWRKIKEPKGDTSISSYEKPDMVHLSVSLGGN